MAKIVVSCPHCEQKLRIPSDKHIKCVCTNCKRELEFNPTTSEKEYDVLFDVLFIIVAILLAIPMGLRHYNWVSWIPINSFIIKLIIATLVLTISLYSGLRSFKIISRFFIIALLLVFTKNQIKGEGASFTVAKNTYVTLVKSLMTDNSKNMEQIHDEAVSGVEKEIIAAVDYTNRDLKQFANRAATRYFTESGDVYFRRYGSVVRQLSIFKMVNSNWKYVKDPSDQEYFAKASESCSTMAGDCDDHTALMAACIKATGGSVKMVWVEGHIFPVVLVAKDAMEFRMVIEPLVTRLFGGNWDGHRLYAFTDKQGVWLNFDYTANYPGGPFMSKKVIKFIVP